MITHNPLYDNGVARSTSGYRTVSKKIPLQFRYGNNAVDSLEDIGQKADVLGTSIGQEVTEVRQYAYQI